MSIIDKITHECYNTYIMQQKTYETSVNNNPDFENTSEVPLRMTLKQKVKAGVAVAALVGVGGLIAENKIESHRANERLQVETKNELIESGTELSLASGKVVAVKGLDFTQKQISLAFDRNIEDAEFKKSEMAVPFGVVSEKTKVTSEGGGIVMAPVGPKGSLIHFAKGGESGSVELAYDDVVLLNVSNDVFDRKELVVHVASTEDIEDVAAQVFYDEEAEDLVLRAYYGPDSPNDRVQYLVSLEGVGR